MDHDIQTEEELLAFLKAEFAWMEEDGVPMEKPMYDGGEDDDF